MTLNKLPEDTTHYWAWRVHALSELIQHVPFETEPGRLFVEEVDTSNFDELGDPLHGEAHLQAACHRVVGSGAVQVAVQGPGPVGRWQAVEQSRAKDGREAELRLLCQQCELGFEVPRQLGA